LQVIGDVNATTGHFASRDDSDAEQHFVYNRRDQGRCGADIINDGAYPEELVDQIDVVILLAAATATPSSFVLLLRRITPMHHRASLLPNEADPVLVVCVTRCVVAEYSVCLRQIEETFDVMLLGLSSSSSFFLRRRHRFNFVECSGLAGSGGTGSGVLIGMTP